MKMRKVLISVIALLAIVWIGIAAIPPPSVDQRIGIYDTTVNNFKESQCRGCHSAGVPDRHHMLTMSPNTFVCTDCHPVISGGGIIIDRNCVVCHNGSAFYGNQNLIAGKPHHNTTQAQTRSCEFCHGSVIDNYNDGHYMPTYPASLVTPDTSFKVINQSTGKKWGGCEACHEPNASARPRIVSNSDSHHNEVVGVTTGLECTWCHNTSAGNLNIRSCEQCHGVKSLHNIQYNYNNTKGKLGRGHIGANWDCNGCHAWYVADADSIMGPIIPNVNSVSTTKLFADRTTSLKINGNNFVDTVDRVTYTSNVKIVDKSGTSIVLTPTFITTSQIVVTIPSLKVGTYALYIVKDGDTLGDMASKEVPITVVSKVTISKATLSSGILTVIGTGFEAKPATNAQQYVTITHAGKVYYSDSITNWKNTQIRARSPMASIGDVVRVTTGTGSASRNITG